MSPDAVKIDILNLANFVGFVRIFVINRISDILAKHEMMDSAKDNEMLYNFYKNEVQALWHEAFGLQVMAQEMIKTIELTSEEEHVIMVFNKLIEAHKEQQK